MFKTKLKKEGTDIYICSEVVQRSLEVWRSRLGEKEKKSESNTISYFWVVIGRTFNFKDTCSSELSTTKRQ